MLKKDRVINPHTFKKMSMTVAGTTMAKSTSSNADSAYSSGDSEPRSSSTDVHSIAPRKIYDLLQNPEVPLRQPGNCLNTDSLLRTADELLMQLLLSQAINDSKGFKALDLFDVEECKKNLKFVQSRTQSLKTRMLLEAKVRDAAYALTQLHASNKKLAKQAHEQLAAANEKVDEVATEVWKLTQQGWELQKRILEHDVAVLSVGVTKLEQEKVELNSKWKALQSGNKSIKNSPESPKPEAILKPNPSILYSSTIQDNEATSLQLTIAQIQVDEMKKQLSHKDFEIQQLKEKIDAAKSKKSNSQEDNHKFKQTQLSQKLEALSHQLDLAHNTIQNLEEKKEEQFKILVKNISKEWEDKVQELKEEKNQWKNLAERQQKTTEELDNRIHHLMDKLERVSLNSNSNSEDDDNDQNLMRQLQTATENLEDIQIKYEDTSSVLTRLYDILPEPHPSVIPFPVEPNAEFNLENFEEKVEGLIKENSDLIDKVIALQKQNEDLHTAVQAIAEKHTKWN